MEYVLVFYYLIWGVSVGFLMSKIAPSSWWFWVLVVTLWPVMLPIAAFLVALTDGWAKKLNDV